MGWRPGVLGQTGRWLYLTSPTACKRGRPASPQSVNPKERPRGPNRPHQRAWRQGWASGRPMIAASSNTFRLRSSTFGAKSKSWQSSIDRMAFRIRSGLQRAKRRTKFLAPPARPARRRGRRECVINEFCFGWSPLKVRSACCRPMRRRILRPNTSRER